MTELAQTEVQAAASVSGLSPETAGLTPPREPDRRGVFLSDVIMELGFADDEQLEAADRAARDSGKPLELVLLENGTLDEGQLSRAVAERNGLDHVDLEEFEVDMAAAELVGRSMADRYEAVPIAFAPDGALVVAVQDVFDTLGVSDISELTRSEVRRVVVAPGQLRPLIERLPDDPPPQPIEVPESPQEDESIEITSAEVSNRAEPAVSDPAPSVESDLPEPPQDDLAEPVQDDPGEAFEATSADEPEQLVPDPPEIPEARPSPGPPPNAPKIFTDEVTPPPPPPFVEPSLPPAAAPEPTEVEQPAMEATEVEPMNLNPTELDAADVETTVVEQEDLAPTEEEPMETDAFQPEPDLSPPEPDLPADTELADLTAELRALREIAGRADALAVSVGNRIEGLEEAAGRAERLEHERDERDERIEQLQRDLDAAKATSTELEGRLSGVGDAAEELNAATETLRQLQQALEQTAR